MSFTLIVNSVHNSPSVKPRNNEPKIIIVFKILRRKTVVENLKYYF